MSTHVGGNDGRKRRGTWQACRAGGRPGATAWRWRPGRALAAGAIGLILAALLGGCAAFAQGRALKEAIDSGQIEGITKDSLAEHGMLYTYPTIHSGEFSRTDTLNVRAHTADGKTEYWCAVMGLSRADKKWKVVYLSRYTRDGWRACRLRNGRDR